MIVYKVNGGVCGWRIDGLKDGKYDAISKAMFTVVESIENRNKTFERRIEKTEKNIESLLKILAHKRS